MSKRLFMIFIPFLEGRVGYSIIKLLLLGFSAVPTVKFSIAKCVKGKSLINNCSLCLSEKLFIIRSLDDVNMLNKKSEFISKCCHINKRLLIKVKDDSND